MKVAVLSVVPTCGKSTLIEVLGGVYSRSQGRECAVLSTGDISDLVDMVYNDNKNEALDNPHIVKAMLDNAGENATELLNYGVQAGDEHVYLYDIMNAAMSEQEKEAFLLTAMDKIPADLTLVEIQGDISSKLNQDVLRKCDCSIICCEHSLKCIKHFQNVIDALPKASKARINAAYTLVNHDERVVSTKKFAEKLRLPKGRGLFRLPFNPQVGKLSIDGELDKICYNIIVGDFETVNLRRPIQDLMEYLFNSETRRVIRSIDRWYK